MRVAFATTCKGRLEHLSRTLPQNLASNADYRDCVFVVLDYGSTDALRRYVAQEHYHDLRSGRLVLYTFPTSGPFRMGHAKNLAHRCALREGAEILCSLDADNYTGPGFAAWLNEHFKWAGADSFLWSRMVPGIFARGISGRIGLMSPTYLKAGGYDERFNEWSPDDRDLIARLERTGYASHEVPAQFLLGIRHGDGLRFNEYPHARPKDPDSYSIPIDPDAPNVANCGYFGRGIVHRNLDEDPIDLGPLPNRIFGIGMHKTATTSLARALTMLGLDCAHWENAALARELWEQVSATGRSTRIDRHFAAADLPIPLLYRQLDTGYPHSKFILTVREEGEWLESVRKHYSTANPYRDTWDTDAFTRKVHSELYGRADFDAETMLAKYREHNGQVREYFKHRPHDLLVMDKPDWHALAAFLGRPLPSLLYPHENGSL